MCCVGGKETPLAGAQGCFLPPKPPFLPPTRFVQEDERCGNAEIFLAATVPRKCDNVFRQLTEQKSPPNRRAFLFRTTRQDEQRILSAF